MLQWSGCLQTVRNKGEVLLSGLPAQQEAMAQVLEQAGLHLDHMHDAAGLRQVLASSSPPLRARGSSSSFKLKLPSFFRCVLLHMGVQPYRRNQLFLDGEKSKSATT